jgi:hypothetical protein
VKNGDDIEYPAILAQMDKGIDVDVIDAINAMRWRCDNQRRELAKLHERDREFKNFHRVLCERFGYVHDEVDWRRDQISLIEHIATVMTAGESDG